MTVDEMMLCSLAPLNSLSLFTSLRCVSKSTCKYNL